MIHLSRRLRAAACASVLAVAVLGITSATAPAALNLGLGGLLAGPTKPTPPPPSPGLLPSTSTLLGTTTSLLTGQIGLGTTAAAATCPATTTLASLTKEMEGLSEAAATAKFAACALHVLDFEWRTKYPGPQSLLFDNNVITTVAVPAPLNLDSDILPEALGTVIPLAPNKFTLTVLRTDLGLSGSLRDSEAELVITDPTGDTFPRQHIGAGITAAGGRFPDRMSITVTLESFRPPLDFSGPPKIKVDVDSGPQAQRAAAFVDLFDENATSTRRDSFIRGEFGLTPLPRKLTGRVQMREDDGITAQLQTTDPTSVDVHAKIRNPKAADETRRIQELDATFRGLPDWTELRYTPIAPTPPTSDDPEVVDRARGGQTFTYASTTSLAGLEADYADVTKQADGTITPDIKAHADVTGLPTQMTASQIGSFTDFSTIQGRIGKIEAEFALARELVGRRTDRPGVRLVHEEAPAAGKPEPLALAARVDGVREVHLDTLSGRLVANVGFDKQPFDLDLRDEPFGVTATGAIEDLPANATIQYLPGQPAKEETNSPKQPLRVKYDAGDHSIESIRVKADFDETQGELVDQIEAKLEDLPVQTDVTGEVEDKNYKFNSTRAFPLIEAVARNTAAIDSPDPDVRDPKLTDGRSGVSGVLRHEGPFSAKARLVGLKDVQADIANNVYHVEMGAVPLEVRALVDEVKQNGDVLPRTLTGAIDKLPATVDLTFDQSSQAEKVLHYKASDKLGRVDFQLVGTRLYDDQPKVQKARVGIIESPAEFTATLGAAGKLDLDGTTGVGKIDALVTSELDPAQEPAIPDNQHGAYVETGQKVIARAQLLGFQKFTLDPKPVDVHFETRESLPFTVDGKLDLEDETEPDDETAEAKAQLALRNVPATIDVEVGEDGKLTYDASDKVGQLAVSTSGLPELPKLPVRVDAADVDVVAVPRHLEGGIGDHQRFTFKATDEQGNLDAVGRLEAAARTKNAPSLPVNNVDSHAVARREGDEIAARVRVAGLREIDVLPSPVDVHLDTNVLQEFDVDAGENTDADTDLERHALVRLRSNIKVVDVEMKDDGTIDYTADAKLGSLYAKAIGLPDLPKVPVKVHEVEAEIAGVPRKVTGGYGDDGRITFKGLDENEAPDEIERITARARTLNPPALPSNLAASHAAYRQVKGEANAEVVLTGLRELDITPTPLDALVDSDVLGALDVDVKQDADGQNGFEKSIRGDLDSNISKVHVQQLDLPAPGGKRIKVDTGSPLTSATFKVAADNLPKGITTADLTIQDLPEVIQVDLPAGSDVIAAKLLRRNGTVDSRGIARLTASINGGSIQPSTIQNRHGATVPADHLRAVLDNGNVVSLGLVLSGLRGLTYGEKPYQQIGLDVAQSQARPLLLDASLDGKTAQGHIDKIPENMLLELAPTQARGGGAAIDDVPVRYRADQRISEIELTTTLLADKDIPRVDLTLQDLPAQFDVCFRDDSTRASCLTNLERFRTRSNRKVSFGYVTTLSPSATPTTIRGRACLTNASCSGDVINIGTPDPIVVPRRLQLEVGASVETPDLGSIEYDCFDHFTLDPLEGFGFPAFIACNVGFVGRIVGELVTGFRVKAWLRFDTGGSRLTGDANYQTPLPSPFNDPLTISLDLPEITASDAFIDIDAGLDNLFGGATETGGSASCSGGSLGVSTGVFLDLPTIPVPITGFVNDVLDAADAVGVDIPDIPEEVDLGAIDEDISFSVIDDIC